MGRMARQPEHHRNAQQRILLAQAAARLIAESGQRDFAAAKRKAAAQLGLHNSRNLPGNEEIEAALRDYQQLFHHDTQSQQLLELRQTALKAMTLLASFSPRLVGPVLHGTADQHCPITLHLFADTSEAVNIFLLEYKIPFEQGEQRVIYGGGREAHYPLFHFLAGESALELTVFPVDGLRQRPLSPVDGKTMARASDRELRQLLEECL